MKKLLLAGFVIATFIVYSIHQKGESRLGTVTPPASLSQNSGSSSAPASSSAPVASGPPTGSGSQAAATYKDGQYTGTAADAYYGTIQVKAVISGGKITDVQFLQYPSDRSTSVYINQQAMPYLKQEAIQAQSAQVDTISGATYSSQAFVQSLTSALSQARA